jgi:hypothetical protein
MTTSEQQASLEQVGNTGLESAREAVQQGAADAAAAVRESSGGISQFLSKAVYNTCYYSSYYVTFTALTIAKLLPLDNAAGHGLHDGATAAKDALHTADQQAAARAAGESLPVVAAEAVAAT